MGNDRIHVCGNLCGLVHFLILLHGGMQRLLRIGVMLQGSVVADGEVGIVSGLRAQIVVLAILSQGVVTALNTKDQQTVDDGVVLHAVQRNSGTLPLNSPEDQTVFWANMNSYSSLLGSI